MRFEAVAPEPSDGGLHQGALSQQSGSRQVLKGSVANRGAAAISVTGKRTGHITPPGRRQRRPHRTKRSDAPWRSAPDCSLTSCALGYRNVY